MERTDCDLFADHNDRRTERKIGRKIVPFKRFEIEAFNEAKTGKLISLAY